MKVFKFSMALLAIVGLQVSIGLAAFTSSAHDFTSSACDACHIPHSADSTVELLWAGTLVSTGDLTEWTGASIDDASLLCVSCHDGQTATGESSPADPNNVVGRDLTDDHPVGVTYDGAAAGYKTTPTVPLYGTSDDEVSCASCHDVHNGSGVVAPLLRITNVNSALCLDCHDK